MTHSVLVAALLALPLLASAQAIRCTDPATGKVLYTDQPCRGGTLIAPPRSEAERRQDAEADQLAREREALRQDQAAVREAQRREAAQAQAQAAANAAAAAANPAASAECRAARDEADFRARSFSATEEQIRTARHNAALACGQPPPAEIVTPAPPVYPYPYGQPHVRRPPPGAYPPPAWRAPPPPRRPTYEPGSEPIPVRVTPPSAR